MNRKAFVVLVFLLLTIMMVSVFLGTPKMAKADDPLNVSIAPGLWTMDVGQNETFNASASGGTTPYTYQWYLNESLVGTNSTSYTFNASSVGSFSLYVNVTDSETVPVTVESNTAAITVDSVLVAPSVTPTPPVVDQGQTSSLSSSSVTTGAPPYTYQWCEKAYGGSYVTVGTNSTSCSFVTSGSTATGSWSFILQVTDSTGAAVNSTAATVTVNSAPTVSVSPTSWTMDVGQSKLFTATPAGGSGSYVSYQWYVGGVAQNGEIASTFTYNPTSAGSPSITVTVTDSLGATSVQSTAPSVTVNSVLAAPTVTPTSSTVNQGQTSSLSSAAPTTGTSPYTYQWFSEAPGVSSYSLISGATSSTYNFVTSTSTATGTWNFRIQVTDATEAAVNSTATSVTVNAATSTPAPTAAPTAAPTPTPAPTPKPTSSPKPSPSASPTASPNPSPPLALATWVIYLLIAIIGVVAVPTIQFAWLGRRKRKIIVFPNANGKIIPWGIVRVNRGADRTFSIVANPGYRISDVQVDGKSIGPKHAYTFANIKESHKISASFKPE